MVTFWLWSLLTTPKSTPWITAQVQIGHVLSATHESLAKVFTAANRHQSAAADSDRRCASPPGCGRPGQEPGGAFLPACACAGLAYYRDPAQCAPRLPSMSLLLHNACVESALPGIALGIHSPTEGC